MAAFKDATLHQSVESRVNSSNWDQLQQIHDFCKYQKGYYVDMETQSSLRIRTSNLPLDASQSFKVPKSGIFFQQMNSDEDLGIHEEILRGTRPFSYPEALTYQLDCDLYKHFDDMIMTRRVHKEDYSSLIGSIGFSRAFKALPQLWIHTFGRYVDWASTGGPVDYTVHCHFWKKGIPYLRCIMSTDNIQLNSDDLLASEIVMISRAILANMCEFHDVVHEIFPVMMLSCCQTSARIIIGWMDKKSNLTIYKTPLTNFITENIVAEELLLRWFLGPAIGNTTPPVKRIATIKQQPAHPKTRCATNGPITRSQTRRTPLGTVSSSSANRKIPEVHPKARTRAKMSA